MFLGCVRESVPRSSLEGGWRKSWTTFFGFRVPETTTQDYGEGTGGTLVVFLHRVSRKGRTLS